ncbi:alpha/beta fold hydrolase [Paenibacillus sp. GCM10023252]|uniref:S9 family peptidase n=1 Tax=Paenibacillus sp. GCM10023252 TaxID=3252649 RepID=UPI00360AECB2
MIQLTPHTPRSNGNTSRKRSTRMVSSLLLILAILTAVPAVQPAAVSAASTSAGTSAVKPAANPAAEAAAAKKAAIAVEAINAFDDPADSRDNLQAAITRGQAAVVLARALQLKPPSKPADLQGFADVPASAPAAGSIYALRAAGVIKGGTTGFKPAAQITREQLASLLSRAFALHDNGIQVKYADAAKIAKPHQADAVRMKQHFIVDGTAFGPKTAVTNEQFDLWLYRALQLDIRREGVLPIEHFIGQPSQFGFQVSPDGKQMAFLQPYNNRLNIFVKKLGEEEAVRVTSAKDHDIMGFAWANDSKLIYPQDSGGDENYHLYSINVDGTDNKDLTPFKNTRAILVDPLDELPDEILIGLNKRNPQFFDVYRLNIATGKLTLSAENPGNISGWLTDHQGKLRIAIASDGNVSSLLYRETEEQPFAPLLTTDLGDTFAPIMFTYDNKRLYAASNIGRDKSAIVEFDPAAKQTVKTVYEHAEVDVSSFLPSPKKQTIAAVVYETDKLQYHFFDTELEKQYKALQALLPGQSISFQNTERDGKVMIYAYDDKSMGTYYFYDLAANKLELIADVSPWMKKSEMGDQQPITFEARDGLKLNGYLTLPKGAEGADASKLPLVVNPHGGPWARDSWGYNPEVQLLANRGYAVLQVNFRGSTGYGKSFIEASAKQWGKAMQDDLTDGVEWLISKGIADPDRVAIYGASYGGYAALAGLAFTPDVYAAGVSYVGPSNLFTLLDSLPPYWESERAKFYSLVGDPVKDKALLEAASPLFRADDIKAPLFVAQGANDPRVKQAESDQIVEALQKRGVDVPYMLKQNEGHGFYNIENQLDFYRALEVFLHRQLME